MKLSKEKKKNAVKKRKSYRFTEKKPKHYKAINMKVLHLHTLTCDNESSLAGNSAMDVLSLADILSRIFWCDIDDDQHVCAAVLEKLGTLGGHHLHLIHKPLHLCFRLRVKLYFKPANIQK